MISKLDTKIEIDHSNEKDKHVLHDKLVKVFKNL